MAQINPAVLDLIDFDAIGNKLADRHGVPADVRHGAEEVQQKRTQREQQQMEAMQAQQQAEAMNGGQVA
jgi:hypothetical protein